jgi:hypothetical protein
MKPGGIVTHPSHPWFPALILDVSAHEALVTQTQILEFDVLTVLCPDQEIRSFNSLDYHGMGYCPPERHLYTDKQKG